MLESLVDGILLGGLYALIGVGLTVIFGVIKVINFAHGDFLMVGMYIAFYVVTGLGYDVYTAAVFVVPAVAILGFLAYWIAIRPTLRQVDTAQLLTTFGLSLVLENAALAALSARTRAYSISGVGSGTLRFWGLAFPSAEVIAFVASLILIAALWGFLRHTYAGRLIRAAAEDRQAAGLCGVNVTRVFALAFTLGVACVGAAAVLISPFYYVSPEVGPAITLIAFVVVIIGGLGSYFGALLGGIVVGITEALGGYLLPGSYEQVVMYGIFVLILLFRPTGVFGEGRL